MTVHGYHALLEINIYMKMYSATIAITSQLQLDLPVIRKYSNHQVEFFHKYFK